MSYHRKSTNQHHTVSSEARNDWAAKNVWKIVYGIGKGGAAAAVLWKIVEWYIAQMTTPSGQALMLEVQKFLTGK